MAHTDCDRIAKRLPEYQAGGLADAEREQIEAHLAECQACRRELEALERTAALLTATEARKPGRDLWPGIAAQLAPRRHAREWWRIFVPARRTWPAFAAAAVVLIVVVAVVAVAPRGVAPGPAVVLQYEADEEADLFAGWHAEASLASGASNRYALAFAVASRAEPTEATRAQ